MLAFVDLWLRFGSFKRLQEFLKVEPGQGLTSGDNPEAISSLIDRTGWLVGAAARNHLFRMSCLRRALVLQYLLRRKGVLTFLRFGVRTENGNLQAHAWLERDGVLVSEPEMVHERYATLVEIKKESG